MAWYYANQGQQAGPVDDEKFENLVRQGVVREDSLVWKEGMPEWKPYAAVRTTPLAAAPTVVMQIPPGGFFAEKPQSDRRQARLPLPPPLKEETQILFAVRTSDAGEPTPHGKWRADLRRLRHRDAPGTGATASSATTTSRSPAHDESAAASAAAALGALPRWVEGWERPGCKLPGAYHYAGFWIRFVAYLIDVILVGIVGFIITLPLTFLGIGSALSINQNDPSAALTALPAILAAQGLSFVIRLALFIAYEAYFLPKRGATLGKMALGLKVIRTDGGPISVGLAVGRSFAYILSAIILYIGFIMAGFDPQKRALHDRICNTYVIYAK